MHDLWICIFVPIMSETLIKLDTTGRLGLCLLFICVPSGPMNEWVDPLPGWEFLLSSTYRFHLLLSWNGPSSAHLAHELFNLLNCNRAKEAIVFPAICICWRRWLMDVTVGWPSIQELVWGDWRLLPPPIHGLNEDVLQGLPPSSKAGAIFGDMEVREQRSARTTWTVHLTEAR